MATSCPTTLRRLIISNKAMSKTSKDSIDTQSDPDKDLSPLAPFKQPVFRMLWTTWLIANVCMWMNDVAAAWLMTSLTTKPIWIALVQTAASCKLDFTADFAGLGFRQWHWLGLALAGIFGHRA